MSLYKSWLQMSYNKAGAIEQELWDKYIPLEQAVYESLLSTKTNFIEATVAELAEKFNMSAEYVCGFIDGINASLDSEIELKELTEDTHVTISFTFERLYKTMVEYKAKHLYSLPQWEGVIDAAQRRDLYYEQKKSGTLVNDVKQGRNEPCACGSGKKYKKCCGA